MIFLFAGRSRRVWGLVRTGAKENTSSGGRFQDVKIPSFPSSTEPLKQLVLSRSKHWKIKGCANSDKTIVVFNEIFSAREKDPKALIWPRFLREILSQAGGEGGEHSATWRRWTCWGIRTRRKCSSLSSTSQVISRVSFSIPQLSEASFLSTDNPLVGWRLSF